MFLNFEPSSVSSSSVFIFYCLSGVRTFFSRFFFCCTVRLLRCLLYPHPHLHLLSIKKKKDFKEDNFPAPHFTLFLLDNYSARRCHLWFAPSCLMLCEGNRLVTFNLRFRSADLRHEDKFKGLMKLSWIIICSRFGLVCSLAVASPGSQNLFKEHGS